MTIDAVRPQRFDPASLAGLDEPVRRYFAHALRPGLPLSAGVRLKMVGRIKVGAWLRFNAEWQGDGRSFTWRARAGWGGLKIMHVVDRYGDGAASVDVRLLGGMRLMHADGEDTVRSGAGRTAVEAATWSPASLLPCRDVSWRADSDELIVASWEVPPERPEVRLRIDGQGAVRSASVMRLGQRGTRATGLHPARGGSPRGAALRGSRDPEPPHRRMVV